MKIDDVVQKICREIFGREDLEISRQLVAQDVDGWDSLSHVRLMLALERHFQIRFTAGEVVGLKNMGELLDLLQKKLSK